MSWVIRMPKRADFCGMVGCPLCFAWVDDADPKAKPQGAHDSLLQFVLPLLGRAPANDKEWQVAREASTQFHERALARQNGSESPVDPTGATFADIGMSSARRHEALFKQLRTRAPVAPRQLSCDEIADREAARKAEAAEEAKKKKERVKEMKELAKALADAQPKESASGMRNDTLYEQLLKIGVPYDFIEESRRRGCTDPSDIYSAWISGSPFYTSFRTPIRVVERWER